MQFLKLRGPGEQVPVFTAHGSSEPWFWGARPGSVPPAPRPAPIRRLLSPRTLQMFRGSWGAGRVHSQAGPADAGSSACSWGRVACSGVVRSSALRWEKRDVCLCPSQVAPGALEADRAQAAGLHSCWLSARDGRRIRATPGRPLRTRLDVTTERGLPGASAACAQLQ